MALTTTRMLRRCVHVLVPIPLILSSLALIQEVGMGIEVDVPLSLLLIPDVVLSFFLKVGEVIHGSLLMVHLMLSVAGQVVA